MASEVLELLNPDEVYSLFTVIGKAAKEPLVPVTEEEGRSEHAIKGRTMVRGDEASAGALHGIDRHMCEKGESTSSSPGTNSDSCRYKKTSRGQCSPPKKT